MSDLTKIEKRNFEALFGMGSGYVLDFTTRLFDEFVFDSTGLSILDEKYNFGSGFKKQTGLEHFGHGSQTM